MKSVRLVQIFYPVEETNRTHSKSYVEDLSTMTGRKRCANVTWLNLSALPQGGHLRIRRIVEEKIQRMLRHTLFALPFVYVNMKWQPCDGFCENAYTGIDRRRLHRGSLIDRLARRRLSKQKGQASKMIRRLVPRAEEFAE